MKLAQIIGTIINGIILFTFLKWILYEFQQIKPNYNIIAFCITMILIVLAFFISMLIAADVQQEKIRNNI